MLPAVLVPPFLEGRAAVGILILRATIGLAFILHGYPKFQHPTSWMTEALGPAAFAPPWLQAVVAVVELFGGVALIAGFLTPLVAFAILIDMTVAILGVHVPGGGAFVGGKGSFETPAVYLAAMLLLLFCGPGAISVDARIAQLRDRRSIGGKSSLSRRL